MNKRLSENISNNIKIIRKLKKYTQKQLAELINRTESSVRKYESGDTKIPLNVLEDISRVLYVDMDILLNGRDIIYTRYDALSLFNKLYNNENIKDFLLKNHIIESIKNIELFLDGNLCDTSIYKILGKYLLLDYKEIYNWILFDEITSFSSEVFDNIPSTLLETIFTTDDIKNIIVNNLINDTKFDIENMDLMYFDIMDTIHRIVNNKLSELGSLCKYTGKFDITSFKKEFEDINISQEKKDNIINIFEKSIHTKLTESIFENLGYKVSISIDKLVYIQNLENNKTIAQMKLEEFEKLVEHIQFTNEAIVLKVLDNFKIK